MRESTEKKLLLGEQGKIDGLENERKEILEVSLKMYNKIKFFSGDERDKIIRIMKVLSDMQGI